MLRFLFLALVILPGCSYIPRTQAYKDQYQHLTISRARARSFTESDYYLVIMVDACHLDYSENSSFFRTLVKHPESCSKQSDVGHAWIFLKGKVDGVPVFLEGGHSGELGQCQPKYFEGIERLMREGDKNPVRYLWAVQKDGFFQEGNGGHAPSFAAKIDINQKQFHDILECIETYPFENYSIVQNQCCSFVAKVARLAGLEVNTLVTMQLLPCMQIFGETVKLWEDPKYSSITFGTPDVLEKCLLQAVLTGKMEEATLWYRCTHKECPRKKWRKRWENIKRFPSRVQRVIGI